MIKHQLNEQIASPIISISGPDAGRPELNKYLEKSLTAGALGSKILGGHHPLSPEATAHAIEVANAASSPGKAVP